MYIYEYEHFRPSVSQHMLAPEVHSAQCPQALLEVKCGADVVCSGADRNIDIADFFQKVPIVA